MICKMPQRLRHRRASRGPRKKTALPTWPARPDVTGPPENAPEPGMRARTSLMTQKSPRCPSGRHAGGGRLAVRHRPEPAISGSPAQRLPGQPDQLTGRYR